MAASGCEVRWVVCREGTREPRGLRRVESANGRGYLMTLAAFNGDFRSRERDGAERPWAQGIRLVFEGWRARAAARKLRA